MVNLLRACRTHISLGLWSVAGVTVAASEAKTSVSLGFIDLS